MVQFKKWQTFIVILFRKYFSSKDCAQMKFSNPINDLQDSQRCGEQSGVITNCSDSYVLYH